MADKKSSSVALDFTNVKEGGGSFNKKRQPEGDYRAKVVKVEDAPAKSDGVMQWLFTIEAGDGGKYPYYCKHVENQLWKIRNLFTAAGISIPKKRVNVDPNKVVGKVIGVTLEDDEYEGKLQSNIAATFPASELEGDDDEDTDAEEVEVDEDEVEEAEAEDEPEEEEEEADEGDELDAADRSTLKAYIKSEGLDIKVLKSMSDDDLRNAIREAEAAEPEAEEDDDELEEIEIEDV